MKTLVLYQGNTESAVNQIVQSNKLLDKFKSRGDTHYLGDGFYFYNDLTQAKVWAKMKVSRNPKYRGQRWAVLKCKIKVDNNDILDLDKRKDQDFFFEEMCKLDKLIAHKVVDVDKYSDSYLYNHFGNMLGLSLITKTFVYKDMLKTYPTLFSNRTVEEPYFITRHFRTEKQYVVRDPKIIVSLEKVNFFSI